MKASKGDVLSPKNKRVRYPNLNLKLPDGFQGRIPHDVQSVMASHARIDSFDLFIASHKQAEDGVSMICLGNDDGRKELVNHDFKLIDPPGSLLLAFMDAPLPSRVNLDLMDLDPGVSKCFWTIEVSETKRTVTLNLGISPSDQEDFAACLNVKDKLDDVLTLNKVLDNLGASGLADSPMFKGLTAFLR